MMVLSSSQLSAKELIIPSSIFRYLVLLVCFTTAVDGQLNGKLNSNGVYVSRDELQNKNVLGSTTGFGVLVVATQSKFHVFENDKERRTVGHVALGMQPRSKFLELKLFSKSEIFYCDETNCGLCTYSGVTSSCSTLQLHEDEPNISEILSASAVKMENMEQFLSAISFRNVEGTNRMMILRYNAQDNGSVIPVAYHADSSFIHNNHVLESFERDGFVYFVTTATQIFEPEVFLHDYSNNQVTVTKIIRMCSADQTPDLASKISILVGCDQEFRNMSSRGETAIYDSNNGQVNLIMFNQTSMGHVMCRFKMSNLEKRFSSVWNTCQETIFSENAGKVSKCKYPTIFDLMRKKKGCLIFSRLDDESSPTLCVRYGRDQALDNCKLHEAKSDSYRYGWLEDYNVLQGELMMKISYPFWRNFDSLMIDGKAYFAAVSGDTGIADVVRFSASEYAEFSPNWRANISVPGKFAISRIQDDRLLYNTVEGLQSVIISCKDLYPSCNSLKLGGWQDPLDCSWCADKDRSHTITAIEVADCKNNLKHECPPNMRYIHKYDNSSGFTAIVDDGFRALKNPKLNACGTNCIVTVVDASSIIQCDTGADDVIDDSCKQVYLSGMIGDKNYSFPFYFQQADKGTQTDVKNSAAEGSKGSSPGWKIAIAVLSVFGIILLVAVIVYYMRNRFPRIKTHIRPPSGERAVNEYGDGHHGRAIQLTMTGDSYVKVFRSMPQDLKIDFKQLHIDKFDPIGQGNYGVVYKAVYIPSKSHEEKVVCKYLKDGKISEFYDEARTMSLFSHQNILKLIGVALDDTSNLPIIVTEYMSKGDLKTYIANEDNRITMRDLFSFAYDIANGMHYLHSKKYIHRDLACRNCLLDNKTVKIADFGLCRKVDMETEMYVQLTERDLPVRWFPPEIIESGFGITSDIWSFGVVIWELFTRGSVPYSKMTSWTLILPWLKEAETNRLTKPPYCPDRLYTDVMLACWKANPAERPQFSELIKLIPNLVNYMEGYDRSQLHAGYERVSSRYLNSHHQDPVFPIYQNDIQTEPLLATNDLYTNQPVPLAEFQINRPSNSTALPGSSITDPYIFLSNCSETKV